MGEVLKPIEHLWHYRNGIKPVDVETFYSNCGLCDDCDDCDVEKRGDVLDD